MSFTTNIVKNYIIVDAATGTDTCAYPPVLHERQKMKKDGTACWSRKLIYTGKDNLYTTKESLDTTSKSKSYTVPVFYTPFINKYGMVGCEFYRLPIYNKARGQAPITKLYEDYMGSQRPATAKDRAYEAAFNKMRYDEIHAIVARDEERRRQEWPEYTARIEAQRERLEEIIEVNRPH